MAKHSSRKQGRRDDNGLLNDAGRGSGKRNSINEGGGGGGSRAAKKRAKKKQKVVNDVAHQQQSSVAENYESSGDEQERNLIHKPHLAIKDEGNGSDNDEVVHDSEKRSLKEKSQKEKSSNKSRAKKLKGPFLLRDATTVEDELQLDMETFYPTIQDILSLREPEPDETDAKEKTSKTRKYKTNEAAEEESEGITSKQAGHMILQSLLYPAGVSLNEFYDNYWEKEALYISVSDDDEDNAKNDSEMSSSQSNNKKSDSSSDNRIWSKGRAKHPTNTRFKHLFSSKDMKDMLDNNALQYTYDVNVTKCDSTTNMKRLNFDTNNTASKGEDLAAVSKKNHTESISVKHSEPEIADGKVVWDRLTQDGCTVRFLCPQKHHDTIHALCSTLESHWGCMVGCNAYLTPGHASQGFAPHYDDIEAFILQVEGKKRWRVYPPLNGQETLPRVSSDDFVMEEPEHVHVEDSDDPDATLNKYDGRIVDQVTGRRKVLNDPVLDVVLEPGDVLYMPRGWIHQGVTMDRQQDPSLHLTISCYQQWSWADFMELVIPDALESAIQSSTSTLLRQGLPIRFLDFMGVIHDDSDSKKADKMLLQGKVTNGKHYTEEEGGEGGSNNSHEEQGYELRKKVARELFKEKTKKCLSAIFQEAMVSLDATCDQIGKRFLSDRLPPALTEYERTTTNEHQSGMKLRPDTLCRLLRDGIARLVIEEDKAIIYHCGDNSREFHGQPLSPLEFELDDAPALEMLLTTVPPHWICINDLIHDDIEDKVGVAQALFDEGILSIRN